MAENNGVIKTNLDTIEAKLTNIKSLILSGKRKIAYAIKANGIDSVEPSNEASKTYMTFQQYADLILRLRNRNAMILEFTIPPTAKTNYKRTIVLPMNMADTVKLDSNNYLSLNAIATEIINADTRTYAAAQSDTGDDEATTIEDHIVTDSFGNECVDGTYTISIDEINRYLTPEQRDEFIDSAAKLNASDDAFGLSEEDEQAEGQAITVGDNPVYEYTVDWGDGHTAKYNANGTYDSNKAAIWHTYKTGGTYKVSIMGVFRKMRTTGSERDRYVVNKQFKVDKDNKILLDNDNYGMRNCLTSVIAWGNTALTDCKSAFHGCKKLSSIPMYDTTNSFEDVTDFSYMFQYCTELKSLPYDATNKKGLFSNCKKATTFAYTFSDCTGLKCAIPNGLINGCSEVTDISGMFSGCTNLEQLVPSTIFNGLTKLTNAASVFENCRNVVIHPSNILFKDCPNVTDISRLFYNCTSLSGGLNQNIIGNLSKLKNASQAFYHCSKLKNLESGAFKNIKGEGINFREAFCGCGITAIPADCISDLTGKNLMMERMFADCVQLTSLSQDELANLKVANARGMFDGCSNLTCTLTKNPDWEDNSADGYKRWYSAFAGCAGANYVYHNPSAGSTGSILMPFELCGEGGRKDKNSKVGMIVVPDPTGLQGNPYKYVEYFDLEEADANNAIGIVYADVLVDGSKTTATLKNGEGNVVQNKNGASNVLHKLYICALNDDPSQWTNGQNLCEDIPTIPDTSDVNVAYNLYDWSNTGGATLNPTRYFGEEYYNALSQFISGGGISLNGTSENYPAHKYVYEYKFGKKNGFLPDAADLWDQYVQRGLMKKSFGALVAASSSKTESNCYPIKPENHYYYWSSAESTKTHVWCLSTYDASVGYLGKWHSPSFVRPSFAITVK